MPPLYLGMDTYDIIPVCVHCHRAIWQHVYKGAVVWRHMTPGTYMLCQPDEGAPNFTGTECAEPMREPGGSRHIVCWSVCMTPLAIAIRTRRHDRDHTQGMAGDEIGVTQQTVGAWEQGRSPGRSWWTAIGTYLGCSSADVMGMLDAGDPVEGVREALERIEAKLDKLLGL